MSVIQSFCYLKVWVGVGVGQPRWPRVLLVFEGPVEHLWDGAEIEGTHRRGSDAVSECQEEKGGETPDNRGGGGGRGDGEGQTDRRELEKATTAVAEQDSVSISTADLSVRFQQLQHQPDRRRRQCNGSPLLRYKSNYRTQLGIKLVGLSD